MWFTNGKVFLQNRLIDNASIRVTGARISDILVNAPIPPSPDAATVIDLAGDTLVPGFIDLHTHGYSGLDVMDGASSVRGMARAYVRHGVTAFLPTTMAADIAWSARAVAGIAEAQRDQTAAGIGDDASSPATSAPPEARILGAHMEGPFFDPNYKGAQDAATFLAPTLSNYQKITGDNAPVVRLLSLAVNLPGARDLVHHLVSQGIRVSCGHCGATYAQVLESSAWGVSHVTHCYNGMTGMHHREPGVAGAALDLNTLTAELICDGIHVHPAMLRLAVRAKPEGKIAMITDSMMATGLGDGEYMLGGVQTYVKNGVATTAEGRLAGSTLTLDRALRNMVGYGLGLETVLPMLTSTPAREAGETQRGAISEGFYADLVRLGPDLRVRETYAAGRLAFREPN